MTIKITVDEWKKILEYQSPKQEILIYSPPPLARTFGKHPEYATQGGHKSFFLESMYCDNNKYYFMGEEVIITTKPFKRNYNKINKIAYELIDEETRR
ncbi:MAG: hypothetical protein ACOCP8_01000 [archaeon]